MTIFLMVMKNHNALSLLIQSSKKNFESWKDWSVVNQYWRRIMNQSNNIPPEIKGDDAYGLTNLAAINNSGLRGEFFSKDSRYNSIKSYAIRLGYDGNKFHGYQSQKNSSALAVEDILRNIIRREVVAAGRTDRKVSAISQIVSFSSSIENIEELIMEKLRETPSCKHENIKIYECYRVPRKFNARSSAIWRRYLYAIPLEISNGRPDIEIEQLNKILSW